MSKQKAHQKLNQLTAVLMMAAAAALAAPAVQAGAGPSGPGYTYEVPGQLGAALALLLKKGVSGVPQEVSEAPSLCPP